MTPANPPARPGQLQMVWPASRLDAPPDARVPDGYRLRALGPADAAAHAELMRRAGFSEWTAEKLGPWLLKVLPDGLFGIEVKKGSGVFSRNGPAGCCAEKTPDPFFTLVATAMATHNPTEQHPFGGELGWVAADPAHGGKGLGRAVCAAVVGRFLRAGYRRIYLKTDDWRLAAIKSYLKLGFVPFLHHPEMAERWRGVCEQLSWPFVPQEWRADAA